MNLLNTIKDLSLTKKVAALVGHHWSAILRAAGGCERHRPRHNTFGRSGHFRR